MDNCNQIIKMTKDQIKEIRKIVSSKPFLFEWFVKDFIDRVYNKFDFLEIAGEKYNDVTNKFIEGKINQPLFIDICMHIYDKNILYESEGTTN